jgi:hypothetical protein
MFFLLLLSDTNANHWEAMSRDSDPSRESRRFSVPHFLYPIFSTPVSSEDFSSFQIFFKATRDWLRKETEGSEPCMV